MEPYVFDLKSSFVGFTIASLIPIVGFILWSDYFERYLTQLIIKKPLYEREPELEKVRIASFLVFLFQFIIYLGSSKLNQFIQIQCIFIVSLFIQVFSQLQTEKKVRPSDSQEVDIVLLSLKVLFNWTIALSVYLSVLMTCVQVTFWICHINHVSHFSTIVALVGSATLGIISGLYLNFSMASFYIKKSLPCSVHIDPVLVKKIQKIFYNNHVLIPKMFAIELNEWPLNILMTGVHWLGFKRTLFLPRNLLNALNHQEIEILVLNQISHIKLNHIRNRFILGLFLLSSTMSLGVLSIILGGKFLVNYNQTIMVGPLSALLSFIISFQLLSIQFKKQELASDLFCLKKLGVQKNLWIKTIIHLDSLQLKQSQIPIYISPKVIKRIEEVDRLVPSFEEILNQELTKDSDSNDKKIA